MKTCVEVCKSKQHFASKAEARKTAVAVKGRMKLEPYKCNVCTGWHLTSLVHKLR